MALPKTSLRSFRASGGSWSWPAIHPSRSRGQSTDIREVGRVLGVRYVLEGSVRRAGQRVRITGQLIDAENGSHLWADRFDGVLDDIFELQDKVTQDVVTAIEPSLRQAETNRARAKPTADLQAYELYLRAVSHFHLLTDDRQQGSHQADQAGPGAGP